MKILPKTTAGSKAGIRLFLFMMAILLVLLPCAVPAEAKQQDTMPSGLSRNEVENTVRNFWKEHEKTAAGMATAIFDREGIIFADTFGYADKEKKISVTDSQVFDWGSISKTLIWVSAMQLKEQGKLDLNRDIRDYLPTGFLTHLRYDKPITMLHLMNHTAGFDQMLFQLETPDKDKIISLKEFLETYQPVQSFEPGTIAAYSNWGAALAGYIIECISGESYASYVRKHIFEPLGMQNSALLPDLSDNPKVAENRKVLQSYTRDGTNAGDCYLYILAYPAGMCTSDINDLTIYARALADPETILFQNKATYQEMLTTTAYFGDSDIPSNCHGFWRMVFGNNVVGHGGNTSSCTSELEFDMETGVGMVVLTNQIGESAFCNKMVKLIMGKTVADRHDGVNGTIMMTPTMLNGPFKLLSLAALTDVTEDVFQNFICVRQTTNEIDKLCTGSYDYPILNSQEKAAMYIPVILWITALMFAAVGLLTKLVRMIIRKAKAQENTIPLGKWSAVSCLTILLSFFLLAPCAWSISDEAYWSIHAYRIWSISYLVLAALMAVILLIGCIRIFISSMTIKRRIYNCFTVLMMAVVIYNVLYWQLYMFWMI